MGVEKTVIERLESDEDAGLLVAHVRTRSRARGRCGACGRRCPGYEFGEGRRRWRALDLGGQPAHEPGDCARAYADAAARKHECR